ncbi:MAG: tryptophan--tRNA ligase [Pseudomonadota bacterium]|nr:tryptophan--tRNA ligase [Pseudomonadota bacterium]
MNKPSLVTGLQSSGQLHIGSYFGTMTHWQSFTQSHDCFFFVADLHAVTVKQDPAHFKQNTLSTAALMLATLPETSHHTVFLQSHVPEHEALGWLFSCLTPMGELNRMTQYKEKSSNLKHRSSLGLYAYPCLMASDVLLYNANTVPVGEDQKQHLELTRNIAERFNRDYGQVFTIPEPYITGTATRVMALQNPTHKMSKSDQQAQNTLFLLDDDAAILKKLKRAVTDSVGSIECHPERPGISNLVNIYAQLQNISQDEVKTQYQGQGYGVFKENLTEQLIEKLKPIRHRYQTIISDPTNLVNLLRKNAANAREIAYKQLCKVKEHMGFVTYG